MDVSLFGVVPHNPKIRLCLESYTATSIKKMATAASMLNRLRRNGEKTTDKQLEERQKNDEGSTGDETKNRYRQFITQQKNANSS